jgi:hypothetical protein
MILFGGQPGYCLGCGGFNDVWVLENANGLTGTPQWVQLAPNGGPPANRNNQVAVYDSANNNMIMFGGAGDIGVGILSDTWVLSNANGEAPGPETPTGSNVTVDLGMIGSARIVFTFPQVTVAGNTTVTPDPSPSPLPSEFELAGSNLAFQITTTATYVTRRR